jgi:hypothetical protein
MANAKRDFVQNQVFVGLPWKTVRPKYERIISKLHSKYPVHFTIVGRNDGQGAEDLLATIKQRISSSSYAVFDATGGNANVSLEYGYAEGIEVPRSIFISAHKASSKLLPDGAIISDLSGKRRVQYKTEVALSKELHKLCRDHPYTARFEKALSAALKGLSQGKKKRLRALAIKTIRALDGKDNMRRVDLIQYLQAKDYTESEVERILKNLHSAGILKCTVGKYSEAYIA